MAAPGSYGSSTTYTILNATSGVSGAYSGVSSNFAFLTPSLSYNANNVYPDAGPAGKRFRGFGAQHGEPVGGRHVLDQVLRHGTGDFATVLERAEPGSAPSRARRR